MRYRKLFSLIFALVITSALVFGQASAAFAQDWQMLAVDLDRDGLLNDQETAGWFNRVGGPFFTDPFDPDTDNDGLTDGEEKLFDSHPLSSSSPGIYVRYDDSYLTKEYFSATDSRYLPVKQSGDQYLITEAMVVRRGATLRIGGPSEATLTMVGSGLTSITEANGGIVKNPCQGEWAVTFPINGTTGTYTATMTLSGQPDLTMPIYVIFEIPDDLSQDEIDFFLYNDDPLDRRDEVGVIWRTRGESYDYEVNGVTGTYQEARGWAQAFWTQHYRTSVLVDLVMPALHGLTTQSAATNALAAKADYEVRANWNEEGSTIAYTMEDTLYRYHDGTGETQNGSPCHSQAGVLTGFLRAAGIPASPFTNEWYSSTYDTSVKVWFNNRWYGSRSYSADESGAAYKYYPNWNRGPTAHAILENWDSQGSYGESVSQIVVSALPGWDYEQWRDKQSGEDCGALGEDQSGEKCFEGGMVGTKFTPDSRMTTASRDFQWRSHRSLDFTELYPFVESLSSVLWKGNAWVPVAPRPAWPAYYILPTPYPGGDTSENWPIEPVPQGCPLGYLGVCPFEAPLAPQDQEPEQVWPATERNLDASFSDVYSHQGLDTDGNGLYDALIVNVGLNIAVPGNYRVEASLYDSQRNLVGRASTTGSSSTAALTFDLQGFLPPYELEEVHLYDSNARPLDSQYAFVYTINSLGEQLDPGGITANLYPWHLGQVIAQGETITPTQVFTHTGVDTNGNGLYDHLLVEVQVEVSQADNYRVEGWLQAADGTLIVYGLGNVTALDVGLQTLSMSFNGRAINGRGLAGPYTVVALRILDGNVNYDDLDQVKLTGLSMNYQLADFELESTGSLIFGDDMESGASQWTWSAPWQLAEGISSSPTHAWQASTTSTSGWLRTISIPLANYTQPLVRLDTCYLGAADDVGHIQVSTNMVDWTPIITYTSTTLWETRRLDLSAYAQEDNVYLRFAISPTNSIDWYVDDVYLRAWPAITDASFDYTPKPVLIDQDTTFTATYTSIDTTLPITYTWDFGDGSALVVSADPTVVHTYSAELDYTVRLTVENPYDNHVVTRIVGAGTPITGTSFEYAPITPEINTSVVFTASYAPVDATNNITHPVTYNWTLGDGTTVITTSQSITHSYTAGGVYPVKLTTSNDFGTASQNQTITVKEGVSGVTLATSPSPFEDQPVTIYANITPDTASQPVTYTWDLGDGSAPLVTTQSSIQHTYADPGLYTIQVEAYNGYGSPQTDSLEIDVEGRHVTVANFTAMQTQEQFQNPALDHATTFTATYGPVDAALPVSYTWDFGGSIAGPFSSPTTVFDFGADGTYTVVLTVANAWSAASYTQTVTLPFDDDGDGLSNAEERDLGTNPWDEDTDDDGRTDYQEVTGYIYTGYSEHTDYGTLITTDPTDADSDGDGLSDGIEFNIGTHPNDPDTDADGLLDSEEPGLPHTTSPFNPDMDGDGLLDGEEVKIYFTNPLNPDSDGDTVPDNIEIDAGGTQPRPADTDSNDTIDALDTDDDGDGILTIIEAVICNAGDPNCVCFAPGYCYIDTDEDGLPDYLDAQTGWYVYLPIVIRGK